MKKQEQENTTITITPPNGKSVTITIMQEFIDNKRVDILLRGCERAALSFIKYNEWEIK